MKQKRLIKMCSLVATFGMISSMFATNNILNVNAASVDTEYDLVDLDRKTNGGELVTDGDFEKGGSAWNQGLKKSIATGVSFGDGTKSGKLPENNGNSYIGQIIKVEPNTVYKVKAYVKTDSDDAKVNFCVRTGTESELKANAGNRCFDVPVGGKEWTEVTQTFNSGDNHYAMVQLVKWVEDEKSPAYINAAYIDNVSIVDPNAEDGEDENYDIIWADDFNEESLNMNNWEYELGCIRGHEQQHYVKDSENVFMRDGELVLKVTDRDKEDQYQNPRNENKTVIYNSGSVRTHGKQEFLYGRIEIKAKLPQGQGVFPAFWTLGSDFTLDGDVASDQGYGWARCGEIDIMEFIGGVEGAQTNKRVWQTAHTDDGTSEDNAKLAGQAYTLPSGEDFYNEYHIFGLNWSPNKLEWYVDDQIVCSVDYSDTSVKKNRIAQNALNRPQYIQLNLATGGSWTDAEAGGLSKELAGAEFAIDYVYYGQNEDQKAAAQAYYENAPKLNGVTNLTMYEGQRADLLSNVSTTNGYHVDYSIENGPMFSSKGGLTSVDLVCTGKDDLDSLAKLPAGTYNIHYTAIPNDIEFNSKNVPLGTENYKFARKTATLTILEEPEFPSDFELNGVIGNKLESIALPEGWSWVNPETVIESETGEYEVQFVNGSYSKIVTVTVNAVAVDKTELENTINNAVAEVGKDATYTKASRAALDKAIASARAVFEDADATKEEVANAIQALNNAIANLEKYVDEKDVNDLIEKGNSLVGKTDAYTKDSLNKLSAALADVKSALESGDKEAIQSAYARLNEAIAGLVKNDTTTDPGVTPSDPNSGSNSSTAVKTGDDAAIGTALFVLTMSAAGVVLFKKRKRC